METFQDVRDYLVSLECINSGGCGISAYSMYLWLKDNGFINNNNNNNTFKFVLCYRNYCENYYINNSDVLRNRSGNAIAPNHMVIYYDGKYLDCEDEIDISNYKWIQHVEEEWFIVNCLNNIETWNSWFSRECIEDIEENLNISLNHIER